MRIHGMPHFSGINSTPRFGFWRRQAPYNKADQAISDHVTQLAKDWEQPGKTVKLRDFRSEDDFMADITLRNGRQFNYMCSYGSASLKETNLANGDEEHYVMWISRGRWPRVEGITMFAKQKGGTESPKQVSLHKAVIAQVRQFFTDKVEPDAITDLPRLRADQAAHDRLIEELLTT